MTVSPRPEQTGAQDDDTSPQSARLDGQAAADPSVQPEESETDRQTEADLGAVRALLEGIDELSVAERADRFEMVNQRIAERLAEFDDI